MGPLKNRDSLLVLWGLTGIFFFSYIYVQSGRLADSLYGLGIYSLFWGGYFFYAYQRDKKLAEKIRQEGLEDYTGQGLLEEALVEEIHKAEKRILDQENQFLQDREKRANYLLRWSHQIKIPMTAILAWLDAQGIQDKNPRFQVFKIQEYIDHILSYQRLQGRDTDYVFQWLPLKDPLQKALRTYAALFIHKGLRVQMDLPEVEVLSDAKWLLFFTKQWLSNVVKYTQTGGLTISFQEGKLIFQDTGIGIAPEDLPRVTDMGYTGFSGRKFDQSTGIGLYLMKEVAENLNLVMTLESQVGQGTRLTLSFPKQAYKMSH